MSDRRDGGFEVPAFKQLPGGKFDLTAWNEEYWQRFANLLRWTHERGIIVQIEVWDRFDHSQNNWKADPYNPANNVNYSYEESGFVAEYPDHAGRNKQPFFFTTPKQRNNEVVLKFQQKFVDEMLRHSLPYPNVLYCIDNETSGELEWAVYWADFIHVRAKQSAATVFVTEMWDPWDLKTEQHRRTFDDPDRFGFVDISQNNHQQGQTHWDNFQWTRSYLAKQPRPINTVKTYGADSGRYGTDRDGLERWWRHLIGGAAGVRFHRPTSGLGFSDKAEASIRAARLLESKIKIWDLAPALDLLRNCDANEAYAAAQPNRSLVIYFPAGGDVHADLRKFPAECEVRWLDISAARWKQPAKVRGGEWAAVKALSQDQWIALIQQAAAGE